MKLIWHGHACFELKSSEGSAVLDPYAPNYIKGLALPPLSADITLCSHAHGDHNYSAAVAPTGHKPAFSVKQLESFHDECMGAKRGKNLISVIDAEGLRLVHSGDIGHMLSAETVKELGKVDVLLIPVGGTYTVDAKGAKEICDAIKPSLIIPMHYKGEGIGLQGIAPVDDFLRLYPQAMIEYLPTNELEITIPAKPCVKVFAWPTK